MCGITAYAGKENALPFLLQGLEKLEYRGYDSAGVTLVSSHHLETYKAKGRLTNLEEILSEKEHPEHTGIGHTRWATHGVPSNMNSHPHTNESETISIVHNGIIENYASIKECLLEQGYKFHRSYVRLLLSRRYDVCLKEMCTVSSRKFCAMCSLYRLSRLRFCRKERKSNDCWKNRYSCFLCK